MMQPVTKLPSWQIWRATNTHQCNIVSVWPDLAKFRHFTTTLKNCGHFERVQKLFAKVLSLLWPILYALGQIIIVENGKILKSNLAIWSNCIVLV